LAITTERLPVDLDLALDPIRERFEERHGWT
jgi:hypothetical protein